MIMNLSVSSADQLSWSWRYGVRDCCIPIALRGVNYSHTYAVSLSLTMIRFYPGLIVVSGLMPRSTRYAARS